MESTRRLWRRTTMIATIATCLVAMFTAFAPSHAAGATAPATATSNVPLNYVGWVYLVDGWDCNNGRPTMIGCGPTTAAAWRWSGTSWSQAGLFRGQYVYVHPYSGAWRWVWTQQTGWLAMSGETFIYNYGYAH